MKIYYEDRKIGINPKGMQLFGPALIKVVAKATPQEFECELELDSLLYVCV